MDPKLAIGAGVAAVGVTVALLWSKITGAATPAAPTPAPAGTTPYPVGDAATFTRAAAPANVTQTYTVNGRSFTKTFVAVPGAAASDVAQAITMARAGHGAGAEGETWARQAVVDGASAAQVAQLRGLGYGV